MRWQGQTLTAEDPNALPGLQTMAGLVRSVQTPEFAGITFHEVRCRSALNHVPGASRVPFRWTVNPYRGCTPRLRLLLRPQHPHLPRPRHRRRLRHARSWSRSTSPRCCAASWLAPRWTARARGHGHQHRPLPAGRGPLPADAARSSRALARSGTPFSILTKGTLLCRDLPLLARGRPPGQGRRLRLAGSARPELQRHASSPARRRRGPGSSWSAGSATAGLPCGVLVAPILPYLTDSDEQLEATGRPSSRPPAPPASAASCCTCGPAPASGSSPGCGATTRSWSPAYERLYRRGAYVPKAYSEDLQRRLRRSRCQRCAEPRTARG